MTPEELKTILEDSKNGKPANLQGVRLPSPTSVLLCNWGTVSDELCIELMRYDAYNHEDPYAFDRWAEDPQQCPYANTRYQRAANFIENAKLWPGYNPRKKVLSALELMKRVIVEKCQNSDYH